MFTGYYKDFLSFTFEIFSGAYSPRRGYVTYRESARHPGEEKMLQEWQVGTVKANPAPTTLNDCVGENLT